MLEGKKIVMLANGHSPFDTRIFVKEARTLAKAGYQVTIIVPAKNNDDRNGVRIIAVDLNSYGWRKLVISPWNILRESLKQPRTSLFHIHDSDILLVGIVLKILGRKVIYDAHEDTPLQISYQHWLPKVARKPYAWFYYVLEKICGWCFDHIIVAEPVIAKYFPKNKTSLIRNFPIKESFISARPIAYAERKKRLTSLGSLTKVRGLIEMLEGAKKAADKTDFEFILGGKFAPPELEQYVAENYNANFLSWLSYNQVVELLFDSKIGIIIPHPLERYKTNYPVKLFEFMAAGLPVIASKFGESSEFVKEDNCGILVDPFNIEEIAKAIVTLFADTSLAEDMGKRGQQLIFARYNWEEESKVLLDLYKRLTAK